MNPHALGEWFGDIDVYLFDQLLRGRFTPDMKILDAGAGAGRNLIYFFRTGYDAFAVDRDASMIDRVRSLATQLAPRLPADNFRAEDVRHLSFDAACFHAVICNAVLHFAEDETAFRGMLGEMWRVLKPGGVFFARLASSIGIEDHIKPLGDRRYLLPDGTARFLVDEKLLLELTSELDGTLADPIKTVNVQGQRCMTTWCMNK